MTLAADALEMFNDTQDEEGVTASIARPGGATLTGVTVVLARSDATALTTREAVVTSDTQDIFVEASDYGALTEPADGDIFSYTQNSQTVTAEARPPSGSDKCFYRWYGGSVFRVHCKVTSRT